MNNPGLLITLEGGEGGGKTTHIFRMQELLEAAGRETVVVREPGGTKISEQIREVVLSSKNTNISYTAEVFLYQASRAQIYHEIVLPALEAGKVVLMDRSRDSSVVYQGMVRGFGRELIEQLNTMSTQNTYPDLTILLDIPVEIGLKRRESAGEQNRLDLESVEFHTKVREAYLQLAAEDTSNRWVVIDAEPSLKEVEQHIWKAIQEKL